MSQWAPPSGPPVLVDTPWRRLDPRMLLVHPVQELVRFFPALVAVFVFGSQQPGDQPWWHLLAVGTPIGLGLLRFLSTTYRVHQGQIELRHGLISRNVLIARLDKVRSVELSATPMHRLLRVSRVDIGTGSAQKGGEDKLRLDSLSLDEARVLRDELLRLEVTEDGAAPTPESTLLRLNPAWVRYAPLTTAGILIALAWLGAIMQTGGQAIIGAVGHRVGDSVSGTPVTVVVLLLVLGFLVTEALLAAAGYVVTYWGFTLTRDSTRLHIRRGLLTTRETSVDLERLRGVEVHEPLGLRLVGAGRLAAIVTGLQRREKGSTAIVPPAPRRVVADVGERVLGEAGPLVVPLVGHGPRALRRRLTRALVPSVAVAAALVVGVVAGHWPHWLLVLAVVLLVAAAATAVDRYRHLGHALTPRHLVVRSGTFSGRRDVLRRDGVIGWRMRESFFQRRAGLLTLTATTSAGRQGYRALDIPSARAVTLADEASPGLLTPFLQP